MYFATEFNMLHNDSTNTFNWVATAQEQKPD